ncbi:MAG: MBL fold metallo-hydrolase [Desulfotignum sp.]|nr:MBL fold metallo-hydrolase [Desulfotignum sp.]MCF8125109.1 MBL fold metallo-hydrolase [Desulfotignum sp.]
MRKNRAFCICPLASGSKGNALLVSTPDTVILVDAGLSGVEIQRRMAAVGQNPADLSAIVITHEHMDHIKGAGVLGRRFNIPVYITPATHRACPGLGNIPELIYFECGTRFHIQDLAVNPFSISHDASDPAGLTVTWKDWKIGIATDLGVATNLVRNHLAGCSLLYLESNHDPDMLINGSYPWHLKQRIKSRTGHLSNADAGLLLSQLLHKDLKHVILAHLSEENNRPEQALAEVGKCLNGSGIALSVAVPDRPGDFIRIISDIAV